MWQNSFQEPQWNKLWAFICAVSGYGACIFSFCIYVPVLSSDIFYVLSITLELHVWNHVWCKDRWMVFSIMFQVEIQKVSKSCPSDRYQQHFSKQGKTIQSAWSSAFFYGSDFALLVPCSVWLIDMASQSKNQAHLDESSKYFQFCPLWYQEKIFL